MPQITLKIATKIRWGKGIYILNNSILKNNYVKDEFYNIWQNYQLNKANFPNLNEWWETGKLIIKECFKTLSCEINKINQIQLKNIKNELFHFTTQTPETPPIKNKNTEN